MSINSSYFKNEQRKDERAKKRIESLLKEKDSIATRMTKEEEAVYLQKADRVVRDLLNDENWDEHVWLHVDMDMFYCAVEIRDNPTLKDRPVAVGGMGMISTANYIARKFGVRRYLRYILVRNFIIVHPKHLCKLPWCAWMIFLFREILEILLFIDNYYDM